MTCSEVVVLSNKNSAGSISYKHTEVREEVREEVRGKENRCLKDRV